MLFSKSFGYAMRSVLYIASVKSEKRFVQLDEITSKLALPRQFTAKVLKILAREKVLISFKGPTGGFAINEESLQLPLIRLMEITDDNRLDDCVIKKRSCNPANPCPVHDKFSKIREDLKTVMHKTTIADFVKQNDPDFIKSLCEI